MYPELPLNFVPITAEMIDLEPAAVDSAVNLTQAMGNPQKRWSSYLALLALAGFKAWFEQRSTPAILQPHKATLIEPNGWDTPAAVNHIYVNGFHICVIAVDSDVEDSIELPASVINHSSQMAHFYVAVSIHEEQKQVSMHSFLRCDQLAEYMQHHHPIMQLDQTYDLPVSIFATDFDQLLLYLTCLEPSALPFSRVNSANTKLQINQWLVQPVVNAGAWLQRQVNTVADEFVWTFFPQQLPLANKMRSASSVSASAGNLASVLTEIERHGIPIPDHARIGYQTIRVGEQLLGIYALVWALSEGTPQPEWSLLIILEALENQTFVDGMRLIISEDNHPIVEKSTTPGSAYLIGQIIGSWDEQFTVKVALATGESLTLPGFVFQPNF